MPKKFKQPVYLGVATVWRKDGGLSTREIYVSGQDSDTAIELMWTFLADENVSKIDVFEQIDANNKRFLSTKYTKYTNKGSYSSNYYRTEDEASKILKEVGTTVTSYKPPVLNSYK